MQNIFNGDRLPVRRAIFLGSKRLGLSIFRSLRPLNDDVAWKIIHPDDLRDPRSVFSQWEQTAEEFGVDIHLSAARDDTDAVLRQFEPDIAFVCGWYQLLSAESLGMIRFGAWGVHNSLLPKYRGGSPLPWSIIRGDKTVGSSVFRLSERMDAGHILCQIRVRNEPEDDIASILQKIETAMLNKLPAQWAALLEGTAQVYQQDEKQATFAGQRTEPDGLIDWSRHATQVHNFVRAQSPPYPCAFTYLGDERLRILRTRVMAGVYFGTPGQVLRRQSDGGSVVVSTGHDSAVEILSVLVGGRSVAASSVIPSTSCRLASPCAAVTQHNH